MHVTNRLRRVAASVLFAIPILLALATPSKARADDAKLGFGVFVANQDASFTKSLLKLLSGNETMRGAESFESIDDAIASDAGVLLLVMPRSRAAIPDKQLKALKNRKVIGIDYGVAQLFGALGLRINGGACAHFSRRLPDVKVQTNQLLGMKHATGTITPYKEARPADNFGMYIPAKSELTQQVDVIARFVGDSNYAPIVRQGNYVMVGLSSHPDGWSEEYRTVIRDVAVALLKQEQKPFSVGSFEILAPGVHEFPLAKGRSTKELFGKTFHFKFDEPTKFSATLVHSGSGSMMMLFMGQHNRLHWTRKDAKAGEPLKIAIDISADDLTAIGDRYWSLKVTNFDAASAAKCKLTVQYKGDPKERK